MTPFPQTALITGASRGLGLALSRALARAGWRLLITARGADDLEAARAELATFTEVVAVPGDVQEPAHQANLAEAARTVGGLDALINNAGTLGPSPLPVLVELGRDDFAAILHANVVAPLGLIQATAALLRPGTRIINITSDAAYAAYAGWGGYGASKAALAQVSSVLAEENPQWRVYAVDPGDMRTAMHQQAFPGEDISDRPLPEISVPGLLELLSGERPSGRYAARALDRQLTALAVA